MVSAAAETKANSDVVPRFYRIPSATYRLQLSESFGFSDIVQFIDYWNSLGITDLYLSPLFRSRSHSSHGYDVVSHSQIDPEIGSIRDLKQLAAMAKSRNMGVMLDVVPNHMGVNDQANKWWWDVLENGPQSQYATYFDIDWNRPDESLRNKLLLPFLGDHFGTILERGELKLIYTDGGLQVAYGSRRYPLSPSTWTTVLQLSLKHLLPTNDDLPARIELESIITQLLHLKGKSLSSVNSRDRYREQFVCAPTPSDTCPEFARGS